MIQRNWKQESRSGARECARALVGLGALLLGITIGCSEDEPEHRSGGDTPTESSTTTTTQPPATDEAAKAEVEAVVAEATTIVDELLQDPALIDDPDDDRLDRLVELYTPDSPIPSGVEAQVHEMADAGEYRRPSGSGIFRELTIYEWTSPPDENTLQFDTCALIDDELVDASGAVIETEARVIYAAGEARRIDGVWRFYGLSNDISRSMPFTPGSGTPGFCDGLETGGDPS
jgi:hypothetical protein